MIRLRLALPNPHLLRPSVAWAMAVALLLAPWALACVDSSSEMECGGGFCPVSAVQKEEPVQVAVPRTSPVDPPVAVEPAVAPMPFPSVLNGMRHRAALPALPSPMLLHVKTIRLLI